jgi:hypothetical protein
MRGKRKQHRPRSEGIGREEPTLTKAKMILEMMRVTLVGWVEPIQKCIAHLQGRAISRKLLLVVQLQRSG